METQHQGESGLLLDVVVRQSAAIFELLASKDKTLLVWGNAIFILNMCHVVLKIDSCAFECSYSFLLRENLTLIRHIDKTRRLP